MYKLLIVEDEKWEREGLVNFLDWIELGIEIVGTAGNGIQGLRMAKDYLPDIILADIKMPQMDGLELSKKVKTFLPHCRIIIVTGYDDFEYAKDAIQYDVSEYLLKPVQKKPLHDAITRILKDICQADKETEHVKDLKNQLAEQIYTDKEKFLLSVINGDTYQITSSADLYNYISSYEHKVAVVVIRYDFFSHCRDKGYYETRLKFREIFKFICRVVDCKGIVAQDDGEHFEIIICMVQIGPDGANIQEIIQRIKKTENNLEVPKWVAGVGSFGKSLTGFMQSFNEAKVALDRAFFMRDAEIVFYENLNEKENLDDLKIRKFLLDADDYSKKILNSVVTSDTQEIICLTESFFEYIHNSKLERSLVCNCFMSLLNELSILTLNVNGSSALSQRLNDEKSLDMFIKLEDLKQWLQELLIEVNHSVLTKRKNREEQMIEKVMDSIKNDYMSDFGIDTIADNMGLSPNYLSSIFKQYMGKGFLETLTDYRVKKAEELLTTQSGSIMDIASSVGFANASYFCTVFKKIHGITPMEFRKNINDEAGINGDTD